MSDELAIGGENLISSKRAAELSGYAQDYIGQLARKGLIEAKRIGGLWYVSLDSLNAYKSNADTFTPRPPQTAQQNTGAESIISFDGRDYVSAARAAKITGYHPDYVGQLARSGKVLSRQIGNRWYVDRDGIQVHKDEKDALLGAVQSEAVGISNTSKERVSASSFSEPFFQYRTEGRDLIPKTIEHRAPISEYIPYREKRTIQEEPEVEEDTPPQPIHIKRSREIGGFNDINSDDYGYEEEDSDKEPSLRRPRVSKRPPRGAIIALGCAAGALVVALGIFTALKSSAPSASGAVATPSSVAAPQAPAAGGLQGVSNWFEGLLGKELVYQRG